jgi:regulatory protein
MKVPEPSILGVSPCEVPGCLALSLSDGTRVTADADVVLALALTAGDVLTEAHMNVLENAEAFLSALNAAERLVAFRLRSEWELREHLKRKSINEELVDIAMHCLRRRGVIDDARFAGAWARDAYKLKPRGRATLRAELKRKGIDEDIIANVLETEYDGDAELNAAKRLVEKFVRTSGKKEQAAVLRSVYSRLARRGFATEVIREACADIESEDDKWSAL